MFRFNGTAPSPSSNDTGPFTKIPQSGRPPKPTSNKGTGVRAGSSIRSSLTPPSSARFQSSVDNSSRSTPANQTTYLHNPTALSRLLSERSQGTFQSNGSVDNRVTVHSTKLTAGTNLSPRSSSSQRSPSNIRSGLTRAPQATSLLANRGSSAHSSSSSFLSMPKSHTRSISYSKNGAEFSVLK